MAITTTQEYFANLSVLYNVNQPVYASLPAAETIYNINLNTRKISAPKMLSIEKDHKAEVIYFCVDRFADYMDLAQTCCVIQYNVQRREDGKTIQKSYFYPVPYFDIYKKAREHKIIFPWILDASVTSASGIVEFSIQFFKIGQHITDSGVAELIYTYNLNTLPAKSEVVKGIKQYEITSEEEQILANNQYNLLWSAINTIQQNGVTSKLYWTILPDDFTDPTVDPGENGEIMTAIQNEIDENLQNLQNR